MNPHILSAVELNETVRSVVKRKGEAATEASFAEVPTQKSATASETQRTQATRNNMPPGVERNISMALRQRERYKMVVGILTALRNPPTVLSLAKRLVFVTNISDYKLLVLQSFSVSREVETKQALESLGYTVFTTDFEYAELEPSRLRVTWGDSPQRVKWRTNHGENNSVGVRTFRIASSVQNNISLNAKRIYTCMQVTKSQCSAVFYIVLMNIT